MAARSVDGDERLVGTFVGDGEVALLGDGLAVTLPGLVDTPAPKG